MSVKKAPFPSRSELFSLCNESFLFDSSVSRFTNSLLRSLKATILVNSFVCSDSSCSNLLCQYELYFFLNFSSNKASRADLRRIKLSFDLSLPNCLSGWTCRTCCYVHFIKISLQATQAYLYDTIISQSTIT